MATIGGLKYITVGNLKALLEPLDDDLAVTAQTLANTGNLGLIDLVSHDPRGVIYLDDEVVELYDDPSN